MKASTSDDSSLTEHNSKHTNTLVQTGTDRFCWVISLLVTSEN